MKTEIASARSGALAASSTLRFHDVFLEALSYLRDGSWTSFQAAFDAVEEAVPADGAAALDVARTLTSLAHIDIQLDRRTMRPAGWSCAPPTLTPLEDGCWLLSGRRPAQLLRTIARRLERSAERIEMQELAGQPTRVTVRADVAELEELAAGVAESSETLRISTLGALDLARRLPALSSVMSSLHRGAAAGGGVQRLELDEVKHRLDWTQSGGIGRAGVYRIDPPPLTYVFVSHDGAEPIRVTARLGRMMALLQEGLPALAHDPTTRLASAVYYAEPPTLYERALVISSGVAPSASLRDRQTFYQGVSQELAAAIYSRLEAWRA